MTASEWNNLAYYQRAWNLYMIIAFMNNEEAYYDSGWLYTWPDGIRYEDCLDMFDTKEEYQELEKAFIDVYESYHDDGMYGRKGVPTPILKDAHFWDEVLGLDPIHEVKNPF